ncbi:uncharacterized protein OCT59_029004 [Rhizophagus irregularis]|uniref:uncharacterized protein n=1 Tax=Rhizophagus irregularis TaxID=588596 RepID=UPI0033306708|nr:hypothetical protein OCT59_029004 [Rhizophagus irregularis]
MSKSDKVLTSKYLDWHAKLTGLPSVLTDRIWSSLYKKYKKETGYKPWQLSKACLLIIRSQKTNFRGIDNYDFTSFQPWSSSCPICDGKHGNYGLHDTWYCENGNQFPYDPELTKLYF